MEIFSEFLFYNNCFFFSNEFFTNDSEIIIIISILSFIIFFYYNFRFLLYSAFFLKMRNLKIEYLNFLILNQNVQNNLNYLSTVFSIKENLMIDFLGYVFSFIRFDYILQIFYKEIFIYYLFKEKLFFFINEFCFVNDLKFSSVFIAFFFKFFIFLKTFFFNSWFFKKYFSIFFKILF